MDKIFRPSVRFILLKDNKILLCKMWKVWWLPWWWIDWWETFQEAFERESKEELWIKAVLDEVIFIQDFLWSKSWRDNIHFLEYFCTVKNNDDFKEVINTYKNSSHAFELQDLDWFDLDDLPDTIMPKTFIPVLKDFISNINSFRTKYISWIIKNIN